MSMGRGMGRDIGHKMISEGHAFLYLHLAVGGYHSSDESAGQRRSREQ